MNKYKWPEGNKITLCCPYCGWDIDVQIVMVREHNLRLRDVECGNCFCDFDVYHDGKTVIVRSYDTGDNPKKRKALIEKISHFEFNPALDDTEEDNN